MINTRMLSHFVGPTAETLNGFGITTVFKILTEDEYLFSQNAKNNIKTFFDIDCKCSQLAGESWAKICEDITSELP